MDNSYILTFLQKQRLAILSTVNEKGLPDAAPLYFTIDYQFNIYCVTPAGSRKNLNVQKQPQVVLTITYEEEQETVHIRGIASEEPSRLEETFEELARKLGSKSSFIQSLPVLKHSKQTLTVMKIVPQEIRMRRYDVGALVEAFAKLEK